MHTEKLRLKIDGTVMLYSEYTVGFFLAGWLSVFLNVLAHLSYLVLTLLSLHLMHKSSDDSSIEEQADLGAQWEHMFICMCFF